MESIKYILDNRKNKNNHLNKFEMPCNLSAAGENVARVRRRNQEAQSDDCQARKQNQGVRSGGGHE